MIQFFPKPLLAIETSCDETSVAILYGRKILSNSIGSQSALHQKWGGVVPEMAARAHVEMILPMIQDALEQSGMPLSEIGGIVVTHCPGLVGSLTVGVTAAKALAVSLDVPLLGVHHLEGHILSVFGDPAFSEEDFPHLCLMVSGGHTELVKVCAPMEYELLGQTLDDAAGEALDKTARLLGLGLPGGLRIQETAASGNSKRYKLPRAILDDPYNFSFSGLKTAVLRIVEKEQKDTVLSDLAASIQEAVADVLTQKAIHAVQACSAKVLTLVGGVAANTKLRKLLMQECKNLGVRFFVPPFNLCTDNAAMIGFAGSIRMQKGERSDFSLNPCANAPLPRPRGC